MKTHIVRICIFSSLFFCQSVVIGGSLQAQTRGTSIPLRMMHRHTADVMPKADTLGRTVLPYVDTDSSSRSSILQPSTPGSGEQIELYVGAGSVWSNTMISGQANFELGVGVGKTVFELSYVSSSAGIVTSYSHSKWALFPISIQDNSQPQDEFSTYSLTYKHPLIYGRFSLNVSTGIAYSSETHRQETNVRDSSNFFLFAGETWHYADIVTTNSDHFQIPVGLEASLNIFNWLALKSSARVLLLSGPEDYHLSIGLVVGFLPGRDS